MREKPQHGTYLRLKGKETGPISDREFDQFYQKNKGRFGPVDGFWAEGLKRWVTFHEMDEWFASYLDLCRHQAWDDLIEFGNHLLADPGYDTLGQHFRGVGYLGTGKYQRAIVEFNRSLGDDSDNPYPDPETQFFRSSAYFGLAAESSGKARLDSIQRAFDDIEEAIRGNPKEQDYRTLRNQLEAFAHGGTGSGSPMETVSFNCGHCGQLMAVGKAYLGTQVPCCYCGHVALVS